MWNSLFQKPAFGIDISDYSVELLALEGGSNNVRVASYARRLLPSGIVDDGNIHDKGKLVNTLDKLFNEARPTTPRGRRIIASLPESKTFIHVFSLPLDLQDKEVAQAVRSEAKKLIPVSEEEVYADFCVGTGEGEKTRDILYAACERRVVDSFREVFYQAGFDLVALDLESASIARAISRVFETKEPILIVDIGARTTNLTIFDKNLIQFSDTLFTGGYHFTQALANKLKVLPEKAEILKQEAGLNPSWKEGQIMLILQKSLQDIMVNIQKLTRFYKIKTKREVRKVFLVGGSSLIPELPEYLASNLGLDVELTDAWGKIETRELEAQKDLQDFFSTKLHPIFFTNVIGLALRGLERNPEKAGINLLPKKQETWLDTLKNIKIK